MASATGTSSSDRGIGRAVRAAAVLVGAPCGSLSIEAGVRRAVRAANALVGTRAASPSTDGGAGQAVAAARALVDAADGPCLSSASDGIRLSSASLSTDGVVGRAVAAAAALVGRDDDTAGRLGVLVRSVVRGGASAASVGGTPSTDQGVDTAVQAAEELVSRHAAAVKAAAAMRAGQKKAWSRARRQRLSVAEQDAERVANRDRQRKKRIRAATSMSLEDDVESAADVAARRVAAKRLRYRKRYQSMTEAEREFRRVRQRERTRVKRAASRAEAAAASASDSSDCGSGSDCRATRGVGGRRRAVRRPTSRESGLLSDDAGDALDAGFELSHMSSERAEELYARCRKALGFFGDIGEVVCLVCQQLSQISRSRVLRLGQLPLSNMRERLAPAADLPATLVAEYDLSAVSPLLGGMLLSELGVIKSAKAVEQLDDGLPSSSDGCLSLKGSDAATPTAADEARFSVCKTCLRSLRRPGTTMPRMSLANGNATGSLPPELACATKVELNLVALVAVKAGISVLSGGGRRALKGHTYYYDVGRMPPASHLPRSAKGVGEDGVIRVVFAGPQTPAAEIATRQQFGCRRRIVSGLLGFLKANNHLYSHVAVDEAALNSLSQEEDGDIPDGIVIGGGAAAGLHVEADVGRARTDVAGATHGADKPTEAEASAAFAMSSSAMINMAPAPEGAREQRAFEDTFVVRRGGPVRAERAAGTIAGCVPELLPFGRGGPDEVRAVPMSLTRWFRRMLLDGRRAFAQHALFALLAFDAVGRATMMSKGALHVRMRPAMHDPIAGLTVAQLKTHLDRKELEREARRRGVGGECRVGQSAAHMLDNAVFATLSRFPGSNEQRAVWRQEAYALCTKYGFPHVFFTVTPDDVNSMTVMYYAGAVGADVFFNDDLSSVPSRSERFRIVSKDPVADARFFDRVLRVIVRELLGWDEEAGRAVKGGGVFGVVKAFFGVIETQGRGALHAHNLVWVRGMPPTVERVVEALRTNAEFSQRFSVWAASVCTASLPSSDVPCRCPLCGGPMEAMPLTERARRKQPKDGREPHVASCTVAGCSGRLRSSEILQDQVLRFREGTAAPETAASSPNAEVGGEAKDSGAPTTQHRTGAARRGAPDTVAPIDSSSLVAGVPGAVVASRVDADAVSAVGLAKGGYVNVVGSTSVAEERVAGPGASSPWYGAAEMDPERMAIFSGWPVLSEWSPAGGYVKGGLMLMQALLCRVQQHSWRHVDSCFKKTSAASAGLCRYLFPRQSEEGGAKDGAFAPRRPLGCEYVNPYNVLLSVVGRCNVDARVLFDNNAKAVVYYIVKYATKAQHVVEPGTVDALAAFEKKLVAETARGPMEDVDKATRRVLSMAYNSSSRMQIPAPLAALHVLGHPGKICSHEFAPLMLAQALQRFSGEPISGVLRLHYPVRRKPAIGRTWRAPSGSSAAGGIDGGQDDVQQSSMAGQRARDGQGGCVVDPVRLDRAEGKDADAAVSPGRRPVVTALDSCTEYVCRPAELETVNWYSFVQVWEQVKLPMTLVDDGPALLRPHEVADDAQGWEPFVAKVRDAGLLPYSPLHPLGWTHGMRRRSHLRVPRVYGPRLPDRSKLETEEAQELYGSIALVLFKPWRQQTDLRQSGERWWDQYESSALDDADVDQLDIMQSWFVAKNVADEDAAAEAEMGVGLDGSGSGKEDDAPRPERADGNMCGDDLAGLGGDGVAVDFEAAIDGAVNEGADVPTSAGTSKDPSVQRFLKTGALGVVQDALCRGASSFMSSLAAGEWFEGATSRPVVADGVSMDVQDDGAADEEIGRLLCAVGDARVDTAAVTRDAAHICGQIRRGEQDPVADGSAADHGRGAGNVTEAAFGHVSVQALSEALRDVVPSDRGASGPDEIPAVAPPGLSIGQVGGLFSLNNLQMTAFCIISLALGRSMLRDLRLRDAQAGGAAVSWEPRPAAVPRDEVGAAHGVMQLLFYLGGEGGTGKSRVVDAVRFFCCSWGRPRAVLTAAFTGLAASAIGGSTLHSLVQLSGKGRRTSGAPTAEQCAGFRGTLMIIVDEVSMLSAEQLAEMEGRLRLLMELDEDYGGLHIVLAGDFFQMPPIGAAFLFVDSVAVYVAAVLRRRSLARAVAAAARRIVRGSASTARSVVASASAVCGRLSRPSGETMRGPGVAVVGERPCSADHGEVVSGGEAAEAAVPLSPRMHKQRRGFHLWRGFSTVVILTENVRQSRDRAYQQMVAAARRGEWSDETIKRLNTRVVSAENASQLAAGEAAVIVYTNAARTAMTRLLLAAFSRRMPRRIVRLYATVHCRAGALSAHDRAIVLGLSSQETGELEMVLDLFLGLSILITKNLATELGVANGTRGVVEGLQFPVGNTFREIVSEGGGVVLVPSLPAEVIWVKVPGAAERRQRLPSMPVHFPDDIFPVVASKFFGKVLLGKDGPKVSLNIRQFPVTPGLVMTPYKVQGRTVSLLCIPGWPDKRCPSCTAYLLLSRPQLLDQLVLMQPLTRKLAATYKPSSQLLEENKRLVALSSSTVERWRAHVDAATVADFDNTAVQRESGRGAPTGGARVADARLSSRGERHRVVPHEQLTGPASSCAVGSGAVGTCGERAESSSGRLVGRKRGTPTGTTAGVPGRGAFVKKCRRTSFIGSVGGACGAPAMGDVGALSLRERLVVTAAMGVGRSDCGDEDTILQYPHVGALMRSDVRSFLPGKWLTSDAMFSLFLLMQQRLERRAADGIGGRRCLFLSPYFYSAIAGQLFVKEPSSVLVHLYGRNVFDHDLVFVPVNEGAGHWTLAVIEPHAAVVSQYDSLGGRSSRAVSRCGRWLSWEADRCGRRLRRDVQFVHYDDRSPQQLNFDDCGFFVALSALWLGDGRALTFGQNSMPMVRERMAYELLVRRME